MRTVNTRELYYQMKTQIHINKSESETAQRFLMDTDTLIFTERLTFHFKTNHTHRLQIETNIF